MNSFQVRYQEATDRRRQKPSFWRQQWQLLSPEERAKARSMAWSATFHFLMISILALVTFAGPARESIQLTGGFDNESIGDELSLLPTPELDELLVQEVDLSGEPSFEPPMPEASLDSVISTLELPTNESAVVRELEAASASGTLSELHGPTSISDLKNDEQSVSETDRRVAAAGGLLEGPVRVSLIFNGDDDIDLHVKYQESGRAAVRPGLFGIGGNQGYIFYGSPRSEFATLDVDANAIHVMPEPCENIIFHACPRVANYTVGINYYARRGILEPVPYVVVVKYGKTSKVYKGKIVPQDGLKVIAQFRYST